MNIEIEEIDSCNKKIKFDIPHQDFHQKVQSYYKTLGRDVKVPGFRKGKVPISLLEKQFGPQVKQEVLSQLISDRVMDAIQEKGLRAVSQPNLLEVHAEEGTDITVSASVEVLPEFELKDYSGLEIPLKVGKVTDEEVDQVIENYRTGKAESVAVTDRVSEKDDYLKIDFTGTLDGKPFDGGEARDYVVQLGGQHLIEDLEKSLYGMQVGETKEIKVQIPDNYFNKKIAGREVDFSITLKGIQVKKLPQLSDEFAQTCDPDKNYDSLADMKAKIREDLEHYEQKQARKAAQKQLAEKITALNAVNLPEGLVQEQIRFMVKDAHRKKEPGHTHTHAHDHEEDIQVSAADQEKYRGPAVKILQEELVVDKLASVLGVEISPDELDAEVNNFMQLLGGGQAEKMKKEWQKSGVLAKLHNRMRRDKTLETALDKVKLKEEMVDRKELIADN